jgi:hypothetical protein
MSMIRGLLDRLVLIGGVLVGGCVPGFITQYHQRVGGRLDQVKIDLTPFQQIATQFHGGDINALVAHYVASPDQSFHATGEAVQRMLDSFIRLQAMMDSLSGSVWQQIGYLTVHFDREIGAATWHDFLPSFNLDPASLVVAGAFGVACWLLFLGVWSGISGLADLLVAKFFASSRR